MKELVPAAMNGLDGIKDGMWCYEVMNVAFNYNNLFFCHRITYFTKGILSAQGRP